MIWQPEFTDKTLSKKIGAVQEVLRCCAGWFSRSWCSTEQGNLRVAEIPLFYSKCKNGRFKVKIAQKKAPFTVVLLVYFYNKKTDSY
ncbi:hypothetical protein OHC64_12400 [Escherichia coli]|uniref:hypothetical protein n=1 Tax=Escherichia coli TaxID=562 RepID=UPI002237D314|nr:hypothetical protein [Escherichia coli]MCW7148199.1 hypothetical protein [Escherichia coli]